MLVAAELRRTDRKQTGDEKREEGDKEKRERGREDDNQRGRDAAVLQACRWVASPGVGRQPRNAEAHNWY